MSQQKNSKSIHQKQNDSNNSDFDHHFYPWIKPNSKCHSLKGMLKLHYEILDFYKFIQLTDTEIKLRNKTFNEIKDVIELNFPNYKCSLYGSFITGLSLPNSDIDILITRKDEEKEKINLQKNLLEIYTILKQKNIFKDLEMINAKVPIITGLYISTKIHVDISLFIKMESTQLKSLIKLLRYIPK